MSLVDQTGRARRGHGCRWCGTSVETVVFEVRDRDSGGIGSEVMCCTCGKHQFRWGWEKQFWAEETRKEIARGLVIAHWLAAQIVRLAERALAPPEQLGLFPAVGE
ncbi:hypothetical protein OG824_31585 [Streptomyces prunicolor]|uniref:hypothetical protein n=1 Tax=Streptomyces prunicolor TaxID=67348 RepID=UPI0022543EED|nr:hypothetical protein [Streptomyces prunicolor]MCX5239752.1 hypothetical protein [Streptomyces prunicolor]